MKQQKVHGKEHILKFSWRDCLITAGFLAVASVACFLLRGEEQADSHAPLVFVWRFY